MRAMSLNVMGMMRSVIHRGSILRTRLLGSLMTLVMVQCVTASENSIRANQYPSAFQMPAYVKSAGGQGIHPSSDSHDATP
jgi:hypothetical protein